MPLDHLEQIEAFPEPSKPLDTSRVRRFIAPVLMAGALIMPLAAASSQNSGEPKDKQEQKDKTTKADHLIPEIDRRIRELDSSAYSVREGAYRSLKDMALGWVKDHKQPFPLRHLLNSKKEYSAEQDRRLTLVTAAHDDAELQLLWLPTAFTVPEAWSKRKEAPDTLEVAKELERQMGTRIRFYDKEHFKPAPVRRPLSGLMHWEVMDELRKIYDGKFDLYQGSDGEISIYGYEKNQYAVQKNIYAKAYARSKPADYYTREICCSFFPEPKVSLGNTIFMKGQGKTNKGRSFDLTESVRIDPFGRVHPRSVSPALQLEMPWEEGETELDMRITVRFEGYECSTVSVKDLSKLTKISFGSYELQILNVGPLDRFPHVFGVYASLGGKDDEVERWCLINAMKCRAFDEDWKECSRAGFMGGAQQFHWDFYSLPKTIELSIPQRRTTTERTLEFKGISLRGDIE